MLRQLNSTREHCYCYSLSKDHKLLGARLKGKAAEPLLLKESALISPIFLSLKLSMSFLKLILTYPEKHHDPKKSLFLTPSNSEVVNMTAVCPEKVNPETPPRCLPSLPLKVETNSVAESRGSGGVSCQEPPARSMDTNNTSSSHTRCPRFPTLIMRTWNENVRERPGERNVKTAISWGRKRRSEVQRKTFFRTDSTRVSAICTRHCANSSICLSSFIFITTLQ